MCEVYYNVLESMQLTLKRYTHTHTHVFRERDSQKTHIFRERDSQKMYILRQKKLLKSADTKITITVTPLKTKPETCVLGQCPLWHILLGIWAVF